ncbi:hypothetical protein [Maribacter sp. MJ134]|nr:hypothetical protein [Maribacter sp. MJ134]
MKQQNKVLVNFQVEELEKRFEMGWKAKALVSAKDRADLEAYGEIE